MKSPCDDNLLVRMFEYGDEIYMKKGPCLLVVDENLPCHKRVLNPMGG